MCVCVCAHVTYVFSLSVCVSVALFVLKPCDAPILRPELSVSEYPKRENGSPVAAFLCIALPSVQYKGKRSVIPANPTCFIVNCWHRQKYRHVEDWNLPGCDTSSLHGCLQTFQGNFPSKRRSRVPHWNRITSHWNWILNFTYPKWRVITQMFPAECQFVIYTHRVSFVFFTLFLTYETWRLTLRQLMLYIYMEHLFLMFLDHTQRRSSFVS